MEFDSAQDVAQYYTQLVDEIPFPKPYRFSIPERPKREDFSSHESYGKALDEWELIEKSAKEKYHSDVRVARAAVNEFEAKFKAAMFEYLEIINNPKAEKLWSIAWDKGHSSGYYEVASIAEDLVDLIK